MAHLTSSLPLLVIFTLCILCEDVVEDGPSAVPGEGGGGEEAGEESSVLRITESGSPSYNSSTHNFIRLTEGAVLNLTCNLYRSSAKDVNLHWYIPSFAANSERRLTKLMRGREEVSLVISPVSEADSGKYECEAISKGEKQTHIKESVNVFVEPNWGNCQPGFYQCNGENKQVCIPVRYRCDGQEDCPLGDDESTFPCGIDPCKGKISCPELDFRCIDPSEYCCDPETDSGCKVLYPCCKAVLEFSITKQQGVAGAGAGGQHKVASPADSVQYDRIFYASIGCCVVLIVAVVGVYAMYKYQRGLARRSHIIQRAPVTLHDLDLMYGEREERPDRNLSITFNINHGVQIMRPPPYSNRNAGPPPPYMSQEDISGRRRRQPSDQQHLQPLLQLTENNNNGDINGNSAVDNNLLQLQLNNNNVSGAVGGPGREVVGAMGGGPGRDVDPPPPYSGPDMSSRYSDSSTETE